MNCSEVVLVLTKEKYLEGLKFMESNNIKDTANLLLPNERYNKIIERFIPYEKYIIIYWDSIKWRGNSVTHLYDFLKHIDYGIIINDGYDVEIKNGVLLDKAGIYQYVSLDISFCHDDVEIKNINNFLQSNNKHHN